ncbi:class I SAM-dependent methyltransferase [Candidatus Pacearchaeota archaeon]|nr:class I SAM-dependent methyltransferase [Candidatus Pacearchaeota archaeon]
MKEKIKEPFANNRIEYIVNLINPKKGEKILNIGISNIPEIEMAIEGKVKECITIDIDEKKLKGAQKFLKKTKLLNYNITSQKPIKENYFDTIVIIEVLEHLKDDILALQWIAKSLKKGGKVVIGVPNDHFLHYINPVKYAEHERHYSNELIKQRVERAGFEIEHFNLVENIFLLGNLYIHLMNKFILRRQRPFQTFITSPNKTYHKFNRTGLDILLSARKR